MVAKPKPGVVSYRENCGGILRRLACGFRAKVQSIDDCELYQELKDRIFRQHGSEAQKKQKASA